MTRLEEMQQRHKDLEEQIKDLGERIEKEKEAQAHRWIHVTSRLKLDRKGNVQEWAGGFWSEASTFNREEAYAALWDLANSGSSVDVEEIAARYGLSLDGSVLKSPIPRIINFVHDIFRAAREAKGGK